MEKAKLDAFDSKVEKFYSIGVDGFGDYHGGYLNFGLWENGNQDYVKAAEHLIHTVASSIDVNKDSLILDVACGMAPQCVYVAKTFGSTVKGLDVTHKHIILGNERLVREGVTDKVSLHHGSATDLPFEEASFSHVMGIEGPGHFNTRENFFKEAYRVLKPGGKLGMSDYAINNRPKGVFGKFLLWTACKMWHAPKENQDTIPEYKEKMEKAGFKNVVVEPVGERVIPDYYREQRRPETLRDLAKVRGYFVTHAGWIIDYVMLKVFTTGIVEYVLVSAEK